LTNKTAAPGKGVFRGILKLQRSEQYQKIKRKYNESELFRSSIVSTESQRASASQFGGASPSKKTPDSKLLDLEKVIGEVWHTNRIAHMYNP
jgi:hypothetical protein